MILDGFADAFLPWPERAGVGKDFLLKPWAKLKMQLYMVLQTTEQKRSKNFQNSIMHPDIIFMDINMPVMNGIECLEIIINTPHIKNIPVVIISTSANEMEAVRKSGAKAFVKKPSDIKTLRDKIEYIVNLDFKTDAVKAEKTFEKATMTNSEYLQTQP